jgi:hypothetical protein
MGRRNSLFSGSEGGAESWSILASIVNTAKLHDLDPQAYLTDVLELDDFRLRHIQNF